MGPLHMLFQVTFAFAGVVAIRVLAVEFMRYRTMFVIEMPVALFLGWPAVFVVFAQGLTTFPGAGMGFLMFSRN